MVLFVYYNVQDKSIQVNIYNFLVKFGISYVSMTYNCLYIYMTKDVAICKIANLHLPQSKAWIMPLTIRYTIFVYVCLPFSILLYFNYNTVKTQTEKNQINCANYNNVYYTSVCITLCYRLVTMSDLFIYYP